MLGTRGYFLSILRWSLLPLNNVNIKIHFEDQFYKEETTQEAPSVFPFLLSLNLVTCHYFFTPLTMTVMGWVYYPNISHGVSYRVFLVSKTHFPINILWESLCMVLCW